MVRVRMAPSPTGHLHIGTARTALFNYLFARKEKGVFVVRIEDTDMERSRPEHEKEILEGFRWLGISWDEGPDIGGPTGPYRQSERLTIYRPYLEKLFNTGYLYRCYCTKEELEKEREEQTLSHQPPKYGGRCRLLSDTQKKAHEDAHHPSTLRLRVEPRNISVQDLIRGKLEWDMSLVGDIIIAKDFDAPLYNFAVVVDDALMNITHVIRGEEHISNTPKQIVLCELLGFSPPLFAHLPLILNTDRSKLSKRDNESSLLEYMNDGTLPEALVNFMALLGWNPGGERETFSLQELSGLFELSQVHKAGAVFDNQKLEWFCGYYMRTQPLGDIADRARPFFEQAGVKIELLMSETYFRIINLERARVKRLSELPKVTEYFFTKHLSYEPSLLSWKSMAVEKILFSLEKAEKELSALSDNTYDAVSIERVLKAMIAREELKNGEVLWPLRVALTGLAASPSPFDVAELLGKEKTLARIKNARELLF